MFSKKDIPDLSGKTAKVTGANSGLGFETVWGAPSTLYAAVSNQALGEKMYEPDQGYRGYPVLATLRGNAMDETAARKLWEFSALATNLQFP